MITIAEQAEQMAITRRAVAEMRAGQGRPAEEMLAEVRKIFVDKAVSADQPPGCEELDA
jgi:hypothetical protein